MCLTERQVRNKKSGVVRLATETPQQLAIGVSLLCGFGMSVDYNRVLRVETQIEVF